MSPPFTIKAVFHYSLICMIYFLHNIVINISVTRFLLFNADEERVKKLSASQFKEKQKLN